MSSNSTVSSLGFNSTTSELSFIVAGPSGTTGYVECTIAKSLVSNPENIKMFLDGNQLEYDLTSRADLWLLYFTYMHSSHRITINLPTTGDGIPLTSNTYEILVATAAIIALICTSSMVYLHKRK